MNAKKNLLALMLFVCIKLVAQPTSPAPMPTQASADVISVFSDGYTSLTGTDFNPNWGQGTLVSDITVLGDNVKKYQNLDYQGTQFAANINASSMEKLHVDIWTDNGATFDFYLVNTSTSQEQAYRLTPTQRGWVSYDIPLSSYAAGIVSNIGQFKFVDEPMQYHSSTKTYYLDNIYFWKSANTPTLSGFSFPIKYTTDAPFTITAPTSNSSGVFSYTSSNTSVATVSGDTITIVGAGSTIITANQAADGSYGPGSTTATLLVTFPPPSDAPLTPTHLSANVVSLFSDAYTNISGINWYPNWGQTTTHLDMTVSGNVIKRYDNINYEGVEFSSPLDVSTMEKLHFDIWTPNCTALDFYLINLSPSVEQKITVNPTQSGWNSFDIPLTSFSSINKSNIGQFKLVSTPFGGPTVYLDNIYFWKSAGTPTITGFSVPTKYIGDAAFSLTAPTSNSTGAFTYTSSNTSVATISGSTVTIVGVGSTTITANQAADASYSAGSTSAILNVRYPAPSTAAPTPIRSASIVKSLFSDAYTNVSGTDWYPNWGQSTIVSDISVSGNTTKRYDNLNYQGVQFASGVDASAYNHLHIDIYTPNCTAFQLFLINTPGGEQSITLNPTANGWNSFDIPLSSYSSINLNNIGQLKLVGTPFGTSTVFLDNIYFWNAVTPTLGSFTVPAKVLGDAPFALTAPSSNSAGAFTYTSSNTNVATISGGTVTIVGVGTSTITATQAADGNYGSTSITNSLVVTAPVLPQAPTTAAPVPTHSALNVISLFSDSYTNVGGIDWFPNWGQSTQVTDTSIVGNTTKKYTNFNYQGVQLGATLNASEATYLHVDVWTPDATAFDVYLINTATGAEMPYRITPTLSSWTSVDIPLSSYNANIVNHVNQLKLVTIPFGGPKVYLDNVYFWANSCINHVSDPVVAITASANNVCTGTNITFTATPANGGTNPNYNFKVNGNTVQNGSSSTFATTSLANNDVVTCVISRTDGCANDGNSNSITSVIKSAPSAALITSDFGSNTTTATLCKIGKSISLYPSVSGGSWSNSNSTSVQLSSALSSGSSTRTITSLANGTSMISYTITASNGCSATSNVTVKVSPVATLSPITGLTTVCNATTNTYTTTDVGGTWSGARFSVNNLGNATAISAGLGYIKYTITNSDGCSNSTTLNVTINPLPSVPSIAFASGTTGVVGSGGYCKNKTFTLVGSPANGVWSKTGVISISPAGTASQTTVVSTGNVTGATSITYTVTDANNCSNQRTISTNIVSCGAKGISSNTTNGEMVIYPNPAKDFVNINCGNISDNCKMLVTDMSGKIILQQNLSLGLNKVDLRKLSKGIYILSTINNNENKTQKLIIE